MGCTVHIDPELRDYVRLGAEALGRAILALPPIESPPPWLHTTSPDVWAVEFIRFATARYGLLSAPTVTFRYSHLTTHAGEIHQGYGVWDVQVDQRFGRDITSLASILAHELAHLVLRSRGIRVVGEERNERLTDTVAVLAGFGPLMVRACETEATTFVGLGFRTETRRLGYLSKSELNALTTVHRRIATGQVWPSRPHLDPKTVAVLACPACDTSHRIPQLTATIELTCTRCGLRQRVSLRPYRSFYSISRDVFLRLTRGRVLTMAGTALVGVLVLVLLFQRAPQRPMIPQVPPTIPAPVLSQTTAGPNGASYQDRLAQLERRLCELDKVSGRPSNGSGLVRNYHRGRGELNVENGTTHDAAVVLVRDVGKTVAGIFVRSNSTAVLNNLPDGVYEIQYALGEGWVPRRGTFCDPSSFGQFENLMTFTTSETATNDGVEMEATTYRITLHPVPGGTARTRQIPPQSFAPGLATATDP